MSVSLERPLRLRDAVESDRGFLARLEERTMRDHAVALWGEWRPREAERSLIHGCRIVMDGSIEVGCVAIEDFPDCLWLDRLYLLPSHQRRGIGTSILHGVIREADERDLPLRLSVLTPNPALRFYLREGLRLYGETPERFLLTNR